MGGGGTMSVTAGMETARIGPARAACSAAFFLLGVGFGLWFVHIPVVAARLALEPGLLGLALLSIGLGSVIAQPIAGWAVSRLGSRLTTGVLLPLTILSVTVPIVAPTVPLLFVGTFLLGIFGGAANVAVNTQGTEIEAMRGKPTLSSFHGFFSLGTLAGSLSFALLVARGLGDGSGAVIVAAVMLLAAAAASYWYPPGQAKPARSKGDAAFALPLGAVAAIAALTFVCNGLEGSVNDWSALYLATVRLLSESAAASGFALFAATMTALRLFGGPLVTWLGPRSVVFYGGLLAAAGMLVVVFAPWPFVSAAGFGLVAIGLANTMPVLFSIAARTPGAPPSVNVAAVATTALAGFLLWPPLIGFTAQHLGLGTALGLLSIPALGVAAAAIFLRQLSQAKD
jgi:MFS family permease